MSSAMEVPLIEPKPGGIVFVAPGQGSLRPKLIELANQVPEVQETYDTADEIAIEIFGKKLIKGKNISEWATDGSEEELITNTIVAQPLIVATSIGLIKYLKGQEQGTTAYGHSIGEIAALYAAGSLEEQDAIRLAMLRGVYSFEASQDQSGKMVALLNVPRDFLEKIKFGEAEGVVISTKNSPDQLTISGYADKVNAIAAQVKESYQRVKGMSKEEKRQLPNAVVLKIAGGFHSFLMKPAQKAYQNTLATTPLSMPTEMNFFSNYSHDYEGSPDTIRHHLAEQLVHPVDFWRDIGKLIMDGHTRIVEVGPGTPLSPELKSQKDKANLPTGIEIISVEPDILKLAA